MLTKTVSGLPTNGSQVYVTLYSLMSGVWQNNAYTYTAATATAGAMISPTPEVRSLATARRLPGPLVQAQHGGWMWATRRAAISTPSREA